MNDKNQKSKNSVIYSTSFISSTLILFSGLILGAFLEPWVLDPIGRFSLIVGGCLILLIGVLIEFKREKRKSSKIDNELSTLKEKIEKLESKCYSKPDNQ